MTRELRHREMKHPGRGHTKGRIAGSATTIWKKPVLVLWRSFLRCQNCSKSRDKTTGPPPLRKDLMSTLQQKQAKEWGGCMQEPRTGRKFILSGRRFAGRARNRSSFPLLPKASNTLVTFRRPRKQTQRPSFSFSSTTCSLYNFL